MKSYLVTVPIAGTASIEVEAENEEAAITLGCQQITIAEVEWDVVSSKADAEEME